MNKNVEWDMKVFNQMSKESKDLCAKARDWLLDNIDLSGEFIDETFEKHPAVWFSRVMTLVEEQIDLGNTKALLLGCRYILHAKRAPFGKIHKCNILNRLIRNRDGIPKENLGKFIQLRDNFEEMKYPPREIRELNKLIDKMCQQGNSNVRLSSDGSGEL